MTDPCQTKRLAEGMVRMAQQRLLFRYPFHARFVAKWQVIASTAVATMAVTVRGGTLVLLFNPAFVNGCSLAELTGVLLHEVHHILFGHVFAPPERYPDGWARTIAEEVTVNEWVKEPLPGKPVTLAMYPELPPGEDTQTRYERLAKKTPPPTYQKTARGVPKIHQRGPRTDAVGEETAPVEPLDDHDPWAEVLAAGALGKLVVQRAVKDSAEGLSEEEWRTVPTLLRKHIDRVCRGEHAGGAVEELSVAGQKPSQIDWRVVLRRCVLQALQRQPTFSRPSRRFPELIGIVPGQRHEAQRPRVLAVIDSSDSIGTVTLEKVSLELERMSRVCELVVVECDARVQAVYKYTQKVTRVHGRGGTDFRPPLASGFLRKHRTDVVLYFTDGYGTPPARPPVVPVIWCLTAEGEKPTKWGREVRLPEE